MNYEDILSALSVPEINHYVRDGVSHSYPVVGLHDGKIVDCYFLYCVPLTEEDSAECPLATIIVDSKKQELKDYSKKEPNRMKISFTCDDETYWDADERFEELYPKVRSFAFSNNISPQQRESLKSFADIFEVLNYPYRKIYRNLFPAFFEWASEMGGY